MEGDVRNRRFDILYHPDREDIVEKFSVKIPLACRNAVDNRCGFFVQSQINRLLSPRLSSVHKRFFKHRKKLLRDLFVHQ